MILIYKRKTILCIHLKYRLYATDNKLGQYWKVKSMQYARFHLLRYLQITYPQIIVVINMEKWINPAKIGTNLEPQPFLWTKLIFVSFRKSLDKECLISNLLHGLPDFLCVQSSGYFSVSCSLKISVGLSTWLESFCISPIIQQLPFSSSLVFGVPHSW